MCCGSPAWKGGGEWLCCLDGRGGGGGGRHQHEECGIERDIEGEIEKPGRPDLCESPVQEGVQECRKVGNRPSG
jgi:hypothetical protein